MEMDYSRQRHVLQGKGIILLLGLSLLFPIYTPCLPLYSSFYSFNSLISLDSLSFHMDLSIGGFVGRTPHLTLLPRLLLD